jgi:hypothetical protein
MKISNEILTKIDQENITNQMMESFRMGSGIKDQLVFKLLNGEDVRLPSEIESYLNLQIPLWLQENLERKKKKIAA